jgi:lipopolysaccharide transport system permease protein
VASASSTTIDRILRAGRIALRLPTSEALAPRSSAATPAEPAFELDGESGALRVLLRDLWGARDLVRVLARKDFFVQYRRASFGVLWALALPLLQAGVLALVVPRLVEIETEGSYYTFVYGGTIVWTLFSTALNAGAGSIVDGQDISTRVYYPRLVLPLQAVLAKLYGFVPGAAILLAITVATGSGSPRLVALLPVAALAGVLVAALSACLAALHVFFRDVRYIVQAALLAWFYVSPVIYPLTAIGGLRPWIEANPVTGVIELVRYATVGADPDWGRSVLVTCLWAIGLIAIALPLHRRFDRVFVDRL